MGGGGLKAAVCTSCHQTIIVKALQERESTKPNQWRGFILSSSTTSELAVVMLFSLLHLSDANSIY